jgi:hypothetical protein
MGGPLARSPWVALDDGSNGATWGPHGSIQDMGGIVCDAMAIEQRQEFAVEAMIPVVMFLILDVVPEAAILERRDAEGAIAVLPSEATAMGKAVMDPFRCRGFYAGDQLRYREGARGLHVKMNVIPRSSGAEELSRAAIDDGSSTSEQPRPPLRIQPRAAILGGPHEMQP